MSSLICTTCPCQRWPCGLYKFCIFGTCLIANPCAYPLLCNALSLPLQFQCLKCRVLPVRCLNLSIFHLVNFVPRGTTTQVLGRQPPPPPPRGASSQQLVFKGAGLRSPWVHFLFIQVCLQLTNLHPLCDNHHYRCGAMPSTKLCCWCQFANTFPNQQARFAMTSGVEWVIYIVQLPTTFPLTSPHIPFWWVLLPISHLCRRDCK